MDNYKYLKVFYNDKLVGTLAKTPDRLVAFEYDSEWLAIGFSISPFSLPLQKKSIFA
jgi:serine/threonine-protein kinase HipA